MEPTAPGRDYRPFNIETARRGIGRTKAYELVNDGLLDTFLIGTRRYIFLDSLDALPQRLAAMGGGAEPIRGQASASSRRAASVRGVKA